MPSLRREEREREREKKRSVRKCNWTLAGAEVNHVRNTLVNQQRACRFAILGAVLPVQTHYYRMYKLSSSRSELLHWNA